MIRDIFEEREQMQAEQLEKLNQLLAAARKNEFYKKRLNPKFLEQDFTNVKDISEAFPLLTKNEIAEDHKNHPPFGTNLTYPLEEYNHFNQTSGTTSTPIRWIDDEDSWQWMVDNWKIVLDLPVLKRRSRHVCVLLRAISWLLECFRRCSSTGSYDYPGWRYDNYCSTSRHHG